MAAAGINSIRFGVGWWVLAQTAAECQPMVEGGYLQVSAGMHMCSNRTDMATSMSIWYSSLTGSFDPASDLHTSGGSCEMLHMLHIWLRACLEPLAGGGLEPLTPTFT